MTDEQAIMSERQQAKELEQAEKFLDSLDTDTEDEYTEEDEAELSQDDIDRMNGVDAGEKFINNHIISKINLFLDVYRKKGYSDAFLEGFMDGLMDAASGINFNSNEESVDSTLHE